MRSALKVWRCAGCLHRWLAPRKPSECHECGDWRIFRYFDSPVRRGIAERARKDSNLRPLAPEAPAPSKTGPANCLQTSTIHPTTEGWSDRPETARFGHVRPNERPNGPTYNGRVTAASLEQHAHGEVEADRVLRRLRRREPAWPMDREATESGGGGGRG